MKRLSFFLFSLLLAIPCIAQTQQSVLGVPLKTTMSKFKQALIKKGYKPIQNTGGICEYKVTYAGYRNCDMEVKYNTGNDSIRIVTIDIPHESLEKDKTIFENLTKQFKEKYGNEKDGLDDQMVKEGLMSATRLTARTKSYGEFRINLCYLKLYFRDRNHANGVSVIYETGANINNKVSVNSDI